MDKDLVDLSVDSSGEKSIWASLPHQFLEMETDSTFSDPLPGIFCSLPPLPDRNFTPSFITLIFSPLLLLCLYLTVLLVPHILVGQTRMLL